MDELDKIAETPNGASRPSTKVRVQRWPDTYTLVGSPILIKDLDEAAELLAQNFWMRHWIAAKVKEALLAGELFTYEKRTLMDEGGIWKGRQDGVVAEWRMASEQEVLDYVDTAEYASLTGRSISRRAQEKVYVLHYHEGPALIEAYDSLPRQAKVVLDMLNETGRETFSEAAVEVILTEGIERLKTKQDAIKIFGFYRARLIGEGHLEEAE